MLKEAREAINEIKGDMIEKINKCKVCGKPLFTDFSTEIDICQCNSKVFDAKKRLNSSGLEVIIKSINQVIEEVREQHPYRCPGRRETYSKYHEGWDDCCDVLGPAIRELFEPDEEKQKK